MAKKPQPFFNPFEQMKGLKAELEAKAEAEARPAKKEVKQPEVKKEAPAPVDEQRAFLEAMAGVKRVGQPKNERRPEGRPAVPARRNSDDADAETDAALADMIDAARFAFEEGEHSIEGSMVGLDRRILQRLRRGEYPIEAELDLHGLIQKQAKAAVFRFVGDERRAGHRCVLIVHGRGQHSEDQLPVLKLALKAWFEHGELQKHILAFTTAKPEHGGGGAVYVLLRKRVMSI